MLNGGLIYTEERVMTWPTMLATIFLYPIVTCIVAYDRNMAIIQMRNCYMAHRNHLMGITIKRFSFIFRIPFIFLNSKNSILFSTENGIPK